MLGKVNTYCPCSLDGLGATASELPAHYLVPMTKLDIDSYIYKEKQLGKSSKLAANCQQDWDGEWVPCFIAMLEIERGNLYYVNRIITWEQLQGIYTQAHKILSEIPILPTLKQQLKDAATFLVGAVAGFFAAGPIGLFTGGAAATQKIISDARSRAATNASAILDPLVQKVQEGEKEREKLQASVELRSMLPVLVGTAIAGAALIYFGDDLKKMMKD